MVLIFKRQRSTGLNAGGEIRVTARHQNEIALKRAVLADPSGAIDPAMKTVVATEEF